MYLNKDEMAIIRHWYWIVREVSKNDEYDAL